MKLKVRTLIESFNYAFEGIVYALKTQRNMRIHFVATGVVLFFSLYFKLEKVEILILFITIAFVIITEMINTAVEAVVDLITPGMHPLAAIAKNVAAGGVLVASVVAVIVGYLIFFPKVDTLLPFVIETLQKSPAYLTLIGFVFTMTLVVVGKSLTKKGRPVQGGMPSGHSALATAAATTTLFLTSNSLIICLGFFLAFLVAESRIENKIHSLPEVLMGCLLGFFITLAVFQILA